MICSTIWSSFALQQRVSLLDLQRAKTIRCLTAVVLASTSVSVGFVTSLPGFYPLVRVCPIVASPCNDRGCSVYKDVHAFTSVGRPIGELKVEGPGGITVKPG